MELREIRETTGMVIPVYFGWHVATEQIEGLLRATMEGWQEYVRAENIVLVVDGCEQAIEPLESVRRELNGKLWKVIVQEQNTGKGGAVCTGIEWLITRSECKFIVQRDADNDHLLTDLPNLFRLASHIAHHRQAELVLVLGRRSSLDFPLGFARGEWERIVQEVLIEAAKFALAREGKVPDLSYCALHAGDVPDVETGYKVFTAPAAALACRAMRQADWKEPDALLLRYGWESVNCLEVLLSGGILGEANRLTYKRQPTSGYTGDYTKLYATQLAFILRRCGVSGEAAATLLDNSIARSLLLTEEPFHTQLKQARQWVLERLGVGVTSDLLEEGDRFL